MGIRRRNRNEWVAATVSQRLTVMLLRRSRKSIRVGPRSKLSSAITYLTDLYQRVVSQIKLVGEWHRCFPAGLLEDFYKAGEVSERGTYHSKTSPCCVDHATLRKLLHKGDAPILNTYLRFVCTLRGKWQSSRDNSPRHLRPKSLPQHISSR